MADTQWLTQAQYDLLAYELKERIEVKRVEIARLIDAARQEGDLRENGGYHAARNEQSMNETRIQVLQEMLEHAEVGDTPALATPEATWAFRSSPRRHPSVPPSSVTRQAISFPSRPPPVA